MSNQPTSERELIDTIKPLIDTMPQSNPIVQLAAFFHASTKASGLDKKSTAQAAAIFLTTLHQEYAQVLIHHRDGSVESFEQRDFHYDIRPGSPYYTEKGINGTLSTP